VSNGTPHSLARIALRWMVRECFLTNSGIRFKSADLGDIGLDPASLYPNVQRRLPPHSTANAIIEPPLKDPTKRRYYPADVKHKSEEDHELLDALSPIYDQLEGDSGGFWWILEKLPLTHEVQKGDKLEAHRCMNDSQGRIILGQKKRIIKVHRSVKMRMEARHNDETSYKPKASFETALSHENICWVD